MVRMLLVTAIFLVSHQGAIGQDKAAVFSGPQTGEAIPAFSMKAAFGDQAGKDIDFVKQAADDPIVIVFVHKMTRPAFGLANAIMRYCLDAGNDNLKRGICFLSSDSTEIQKKLNRSKNYFPKRTLVGYSTDGLEGPGAYGLNRNVEVTVIVGKEKKVTANFALVQPGVHADGPKILQAIANVIGSDVKPEINKYLPNNQAAQDAPIAIDPKLMSQIRQINAKDASDEMVGQGIEEIKKLIDGKGPLQRQLGSIVNRWVRSGRVNSIGNESHQATIKEWAKTFAPRNNRQMNRRPQDGKFTAMLRQLIQKSNSDQQVDEAAAAIDKYVKVNPAAEKELARISTTITNGGKLENYGTKHCQEVLKTWAEKYKTDK